jgi:apolipoprotein N-acyltransferase
MIEEPQELHGMTGTWKLWAVAAVSAALLELPFPMAGPLPLWRTVIAWFALVPLLWAILTPARARRPRSLRYAFLLAYLCGFLWYAGNCYWVRDTMMRYGDMPPMAPTLLLMGFSLVLGLYIGLFGLAVALVQRSTGSTRLALVSAPILWTALELAASRITSVPWDQFGYSQVDNALVTQFAPWTGVYGISFLLVAVNALLAGGVLLVQTGKKMQWGVCGLFLAIVGSVGVLLPAPQPAATATATLIQPNLDVGLDNNWQGAEWERHIAEFERLVQDTCRNYIAGIPQTGAPVVTPQCNKAAASAHPDLVAWPEAPAPFVEADGRFRRSMAKIARDTQASMMIGNIGMDYEAENSIWHDYNSALVLGPDGTRLGRYDKIHLVPFGEYIPFKNLLFFAHKLTGRVSEFTRGTERKVFSLNGHRYGVFICYEAVFADEVRHFANSGAEVLVNISDDGWYGDTSAPWQHLNMSRMRAIENRRWILRDTNNGVTAVIDPYGRVRQSIPRHAVDSLAARYGFESRVTFYTAHGDLFAWACAILALGLVILVLRADHKRRVQIKVRS